MNHGRDAPATRSPTMTEADASSSPPPATEDSAHDPWPDAQRVEAFAGEVRVNLVRLVALLAFYARHVVQMLLAAPDDPVRGMYHVRVTVVSAAWAGMVIALHWLLSRRRVYPWLPYASSLLDVLLITLLCAIAADPRSPLTLLFFLAIAASPTRLSLRVVWLTTAAAVIGYLVVLAHYAWVVVGYDRYYGTPELRIPRSHETTFILALIVAGGFAGQCVRQARRLVSGPIVSRAPDEAPREA